MSTNRKKKPEQLNLSKKKSEKASGANKGHAKSQASKNKKKLIEHTAFKNKDKKKKKNRTSIWVNRATLQYEDELHKLQIELLKMQKYVKKKGLRLLMLFEGRDAAGKGGTIKRITEHLNPRGTRSVALMTPDETERTQWYFQRYIQHLPANGEIVLFDRSWYNRAMVEPVMGFCTDEQNKRFLKDVPLLEEMLVKDGIILFKYFFSVSKGEQLRRFVSRETDPLKHFKISPVDRVAQDKWDDYTVRKFQMLNETNRTLAPWTIIRSDYKKAARLNCIKHILLQIDYAGKVPAEELKIDPEVVISGIDEIKNMEENLLTPVELPG